MYQKVQEKAKSLPKTVDANELYDQITLQLDSKKQKLYEKHHQAWEMKLREKMGISLTK